NKILRTELAEKSALIERISIRALAEIVEDRGSRIEDRRWRIALRAMTRSSILYPLSSILFGLRFDYFEQCDLRRAAVEQRHDNGSETPVDVKLSRAELRVAPNQAAAGAAQPAGGLSVFASGEEPPVDLTAMRVARKHQVDARARGFADDRRVVREQYSRLVPVRRFQRLPEVVPSEHQVVDAGEPAVGSASF